MNAGVRFYDESSVLPPLFHVKASVLKAKNVENETDFFDLDCDNFDDFVLHDTDDGGYEGIGFHLDEPNEHHEYAPLPEELEDNPF